MTSLEVRARSLAFVAAFVVLAEQVLVHRMVSVKLVNNYAFLVISLCMLGFGVSGVLLSRWQRVLLARFDDAAAWSAVAFGWTLCLAMAIFYAVPPGPQWAASRGAFVVSFLKLVPLAFVFTLPFAAAGLLIGLLLALPNVRTRVVYGYDLLGSAAGALLVLPAIGPVSVESAALIGAVILAGAAAFFLRPKGRAASAAVYATPVLLASAALVPGVFFRMSYPEGSVLAATQVPGSGFVLEHILWDPVARVELSRIPAPRPETVAWPYLIGRDPAFLSSFERIVTQNNTAYTYAVRYDGRSESIAGIDETMYVAAYKASTVRNPRVAVIGVGGGFDILAALRHDAASVIGVEVNGATLDLVTRIDPGYFRSWADDPRVRLVHEEGRHFLARHPGRFDILQLSGVDSVSGTPAAAHVFSESYLYTSQAMDLFLARLDDDGVLNLMRAEYRPPREMLRALVTAIFALRRAGVAKPSDHIAVVGSRDELFVALLVRKSPFTAAAIEQLREWTARSPFFELIAAPGYGSSRANVFEMVLGLGDPRLESAFVARYPLDIRPVGDERPFFFRFTFWSHLLPGVAVAATTVPVMELGLLLLMGVALVATGLCLVVPLRILSGEGLAIPQATRLSVYFGALGLGFLAVEMALIQKFGLLLGHPNYALSVVLALLLLSSGAGALLSERLLRLAGNARFLAYALALVVLVELLLVFPRLHAVDPLGFGVRVAVVAALIAPIGLLLGIFFPAGLARLKETAPAFVPWAWGLNGALSVLAPILGVAVSVTAGVEALLLLALPVYLLAGFCFPTGKPAEGGLA